MRALIIIGGAVAGYLLLSRLSRPAVAAPAAPPRVSPDGYWQPNLPIPGFAQATSLVKPIADNLTTPLIHKLNESIGGTNPYGPPKVVKNADGSITTFEGPSGSIEITHYPDGHETHKVHYGVNPKVKAAGVAAWGAAKAGGSAIKTVVTAPIHFVEGLF